MGYWHQPGFSYIPSKETALVRHRSAPEAESPTPIAIGNRAAIAGPVAAESPVLWRAARGAGLSEADAEDVVQETLLVFLRRFEDYDGSASQRTWLFGILLNKIRELRRAGAREEAMADIETVLDARFDPTGRWIRPPRTADATVALQPAGEWLNQCLEGLPERSRFAFFLKEAEGHSTGEICKILEVTANNLGVILFRARAALRECLEAKGIRRSSDATL